MDGWKKSVVGGWEGSAGRHWAGRSWMDASTILTCDIVWYKERRCKI